MTKIAVQVFRINPTKDPAYGYKVHTSHGIFRAPPGDMPVETGKSLKPPVPAIIDIEGGVISSIITDG